MLKIVIAGAAGRMGRMLVNLVMQAGDMELSGALEIAGSPFVGSDAGVIACGKSAGVLITDDIAEALKSADAVINFSTGGVLPVARAAAAAGIAMVIGTTAIPAEEKAAIAGLVETAGARIVMTPNMAIGVNLLFHLAKLTAAKLGADYDIEIVEMHHRNKKDAPSGTALRLAEVVCEARDLQCNEALRHGRSGITGTRTNTEVGMHSLRGGDVVGDHTVIFAADGERIELCHKASSRESFAKGALNAARFLASAAPGMYDMQDVLGL